jgi:hypothetical protein
MNGSGTPAILQIEDIDTKLIRQMEIIANASANLDILVDNENRFFCVGDRK